MDKRYQVFLSSTYTDLKDERRHVIQTLLEMDCIPAGMELFPAADEEQMEFIKRVIDDCDYYLLIVGSRYGTITPEGISYTEKEYDYAVSIGLRVIAFIQEQPETSEPRGSDEDSVLRQKLQEFRDKIAANRIIKHWNTGEELAGKVALSLAKTIKMFPATGWVRASTTSSEELLVELNELRKESALLRSRISELEIPDRLQVDGIAGLDEVFTITGTYWKNNLKYEWTSTLSWRDIFSLLAPYLNQNPNHDKVKNTLKLALLKRENKSARTSSLDDQEFQTVTVQLRALGLVVTVYSKTTQGGMALFWHLTPKGEKLMMHERTVKSTPVLPGLGGLCPGGQD